MAGNAAKRALWRARIESWKDSGLTRQAYCLREGVSLSAFDYWRRQLACGVPAGLEATSADQRLTLVPVRITPQTDGQTCVLSSSGGWSLRLPLSTPAQWLGDVLKCLP